MCCSSDHTGAPPEWHKELADENPAAPPRFTPAALAAWARLLRPLDFAPAERPVSTEGGNGRALPRLPWGDLQREDDWMAEFGLLPDGGAEPQWATRPRGLRAPRG